MNAHPRVTIRLGLQARIKFKVWHIKIQRALQTLSLPAGGRGKVRESVLFPTLGFILPVRNHAPPEEKYNDQNYRSNGYDSRIACIKMRHDEWQYANSKGRREMKCKNPYDCHRGNHGEKDGQGARPEPANDHHGGQRTQTTDHRYHKRAFHPGTCLKMRKEFQRNHHQRRQEEESLPCPDGGAGRDN